MIRGDGEIPQSDSLVTLSWMQSCFLLFVTHVGPRGKEYFSILNLRKKKRQGVGYIMDDVKENASRYKRHAFLFKRVASKNSGHVCPWEIEARLMLHPNEYHERWRDCRMLTGCWIKELEGIPGNDLVISTKNTPVNYTKRLLFWGIFFPLWEKNLFETSPGRSVLDGRLLFLEPSLDIAEESSRTSISLQQSIWHWC